MKRQRSEPTPPYTTLPYVTSSNCSMWKSGTKRGVLTPRMSNIHLERNRSPGEEPKRQCLGSEREGNTYYYAIELEWMHPEDYDSEKPFGEIDKHNVSIGRLFMGYMGGDGELTDAQMSIIDEYIDSAQRLCPQLPAETLKISLQRIPTDNLIGGLGPVMPESVREVNDMLLIGMQSINSKLELLGVHYDDDGDLIEGEPGADIYTQPYQPQC